MMRKARIQQSIVVEVADYDPWPDFHESLVWVECSNEVAQGWLYEFGVFSAPQPAIDQLKVKIADRRYCAEIAGISINGMFIDTHRDSQALITGATVSAMMDDTYICNWKTRDGFVQLDAATLKTICKAVRDHVQACFDREAQLLAALNNGSFADDMLNVGWPE